MPLQAPWTRHTLRAGLLCLLGLVIGAAPSAHGLDGLTGITEAADARYVARGAGQVVLLDASGLTLVPRAAHQPALRLTFLGANPDPELTPEAPLPGRVHVARGADPAAWRRDLARYADLRYVDLYPGVDLVLHATDGALKRDLLVAPHADPGAIAFRYDGARSVDVSPDGALLVHTGRGLVTEAPPFAWQPRGDTRDLVLVDWQVTPDGRITYDVGDYDPALPLVIDPGLDFAAYVGGDGYDEVNAVTTDAQGFVYLAGSTTSVDLPMAGAGDGQTLQTNTLDGDVYRSTDAFVMKLTPDGALVWASFYGGKTDKFPSSLCRDDTPAIDPNLPCFDLVASPWGLGGVDVALALAVAPDGSVAVVGETNATDFPAFPIATTIQRQLSGRDFDPARPDDHYASDAFFTRFDPTGDVTLSTYLGGTRRDVARGVAFDHAGDAWVVGLTGSSDFPTTDDRLQPYLGGAHTGLSDEDYDAFVARIHPTGVFVLDRLAFSTTLGGYGYDEANAVAVSTSGQVAVAGTTSATALGGGSSNGAQPSYGGGGEDGFVAILAESADGDLGLLQQTFIGGANADELGDVALLETPSGAIRRVIVAGATDSPALWSAACGARAYDDCGSDGTCDDDGVFSRHDDAFVLAFDLHYPSTCAFRRYLGGEVRDEANALDVDPTTGELFVTGTTWSADFPTVAALQPKKADGRSAGCLPSDPFDCVDNSDAFYARISADGKDLLISSFLGGRGRGYDSDDVGHDLAYAAAPGARHLFLAGQTWAADFPSFNPALTQPTDTTNVANGFLARAPLDIADLRIADATLAPAVAERGETVTLTVKLRNDGPESTDHVKLTVRTSQPVTWLNPPPSCGVGPDDVECAQPKTLQRGQEATYTLTIEAPATRQKLILDLVATGDRRDPNDENNRRRLTLPVGGYDLAVAASATPDPVGFGKHVTYTVSATNSGPEPARNVALELHFDPTIATFVPQGTTAGCAVGTPTDRVVCQPVDPVAKGQTVGPVTIVLRAPEETKDLRVVARYGADGDPDDDQNHANDKKPVVTRVRPADVALLSAEPAPEPVATKSSLTIVAVLKNLGPGDAVGPTLYLEPSSAALAFAAEGSDIRCKEVFPNGEHAFCELPPNPDGTERKLAEGASETFTLTFRTPDAPGTVVTKVLAAAIDETEKGNNLRTVTSHVGHADLAVQSVVVADPAAPPYGAGEPLTVVATIANTTLEVDAKDVVVEYTATSTASGAGSPPFEQPVVAATTSTGGVGACQTGPPLRCTFATLAGGETAAVYATMPVTTRPTHRGTQSHTFAVAAIATPDPNPANDRKTLDTPISGHDLALAVTPPADPLQRKGVATWSARVSNLGPGVAKSAVLNISFDTTYYGWVGNTTNSSGGACTPSNASFIQCALGRLAKGENVDLTWQIEPVHSFDPTTTSDIHAATMDLDVIDVTGDDEQQPNNAQPLRVPIAGANLAVLSSGPTAPVQIDDAIAFHAAVANLGPADSKNARLHVEYDAARLEPTSSDDPARPCTPVAAGKLRCELDPLPAGGTPIDLGLAFKALAPGKPKTTLRVTDGPDETEEITPANNRAEITTTIQGADLRIASPAQDPTGPVSVTRAVRYTFAAQNPSTKAKTPGFSAVFALDAAAAGKARIVNATIGGATPCAIAPSERSVSCLWPAGLPKAAAPGAPATVAIAVDTLGLDRGTYTATAAVQLVADADSDPDPANNALAAGAFTTTREGHDLAVTVTRDDAPFQKKRGDQVVYTATVRNNRRTTAEAVGLTFDFTGGKLARRAIAEPPGGCDVYDSPGLANCALGDIPYGESRSVVFTMDAKESGDATLRFATSAHGNALLADPPKTDDQTTATLHVVGADLAITAVTWPTGPVQSGQPVDLEVTLKNQTTTGHVPAVSRPVTLTHTGFVAPGQNPHLVYVGSSIGQPVGGPACVDSGAALRCQLGAFQVDEVAKVYLRYKAGKPGTFTHTLTAAEPAGTLDEAPSDNTASRTSEVKGPNVVIAKVSADTPTGVGNTAVSIGYEVRNASTDTTARDVKLRFTYSELSSGPAGGFTPAPSNQDPLCTVGAGSVECTVGDLGPGASAPLVASLWRAEKVGDYRVVVRAESDAEDAAPLDNVTVQAMEVKGPDLAVVGTPFTGTPARGEPFTLNVSVQNVGLGESKETWLDLPLSPAVTFQSATVTPVGAGSCAAARLPSGADGVRCDLGEVRKGELTRQIAMTLVAKKKGTYGFDFTAVTAPHADASAANQTASLSLDFHGADLAVTGLTGPGTTEANHGDEVTFNVTLRNGGPADAIGPRLTHLFNPKHLVFLRATGDGTCGSDPTGLTTCALTALPAASGPADYALVGLTYRAEDPGAVTSDFTVSEPGQSDENPADNTASKTTTVRGADLGVAVVDAPDPVALEQTVTYTSTVTNHGPADAKHVVATLLLPREVRFASATPGCTVGLRTVECAPYDLAAGASRVWTVTATPLVATVSARARTAATAPGSEEPGGQPDTAWVGTTIVDGDADSDGVSSQTEDGAPNGGDGNADGIPDKDQPAVSSVPNGRGDYTTLETSQGALRGVATQAPPTPTPAGVAFPVDALRYEVTGLAPGATTTVTITTPTGVPAWAYWKYGPEPGDATPHWYDFSFDGTTGARKVASNQLEVVLVDGARGDDDLAANGVIVDPGALALRLLVVDSAGDGADADPGDGACDAGDGTCTLRAAIEESNAHAASHLIAFGVVAGPLPVVIDASGGLPTITAPVVVDGATQPGWVDAPVVTIGAPAWSVGAGDSALRSLDLPGGASVIGAGRALITDSVTQVDLVGVDRCLVRRATLDGVAILGPAVGNRLEDSEVVGAVTLSDASATLLQRNSIHDAFGESAITLSGGGATDNRLVGNLIGLDADGACTHYASDPSTNTPGAGPCDGAAGGWGVHVTGGAWANDIGGGFGEGNVISGNGLGGVLLDGGAHDNTVAGNLFGTDLDGVAARHPVSATYQLENRGPCVRIDGASDNVVGGAGDLRNVCAGRGMAVVGASDGNRIDGNWIMLDARGDVPWVRLTLDDVLLVRDATDTVIADNVVPTIEVAGSAAGTRIEGNRIGTDPTGTLAFYADRSIPGTTRIWSRGVLVHDQASETTISDNLISGSYLHGVDLWEAASFVTLTDNRVGVDATGVAALPNLKSGIHVDARYGGTVSDVLIDGNVVAGNGTDHDWVSDPDWPFAGVWVREGAARVTIRDNTVGLGADGVTPLGHLTHGIWANGAPDLAITGNLVGANAGDGIRVDDGPLFPYPSDGAVLRGNVVGTDALGLLDLGNGGFGIRVHESGAVLVGGVAPGEGNVVAHNHGAGIWVEAGGQGTTVRGNSLYDNDGLGFDLNFLGVDRNGVYDGTTNADPDHPVLAAASEDAGVITVSGTHGPALGGAYTLDFYLDPAPDPTGHGEGRAWLGSDVLAGTDAFTVDLPRAGAVGAFVTATATDAAGNTSELSRFVWVDAAPSWTDLGVTLAEGLGGDPTCVGCLVTWFADVTVSGPDDADGVSLVFDYPAGVDYAGEDAGSFTCLASPPTTTCNAETLPVGQHQLRFYGVTTAPGVIAATATVSTTTTDPAPLNDADDEETTVGPADLGVSVAEPGPAAVGEPLQLVATVTNPGITGGETATPTLTLALPPDVAFDSGAGGACAEDTGTVTCALPPLVADATAEVRLTVTPATPGTATFAFAVSAPNPDRDATNNNASVAVDVRERAYDVAVTQAVAPADPEVDEPFTHLVTITNAGPSTALDVVLTDTLQLQAYAARAVPSQGECYRDQDAEGTYLGTVSCYLGDLPRGASATVELTAVTDLSLTIQNIACVAALGEDVAPGNDCDTRVTAVGAVDLKPALVADPNPATAGAPLALTASVHNAGPTTARAVTVAVGLPDLATFTSADAPCDVALDPQTTRNVATCALGDVAAGADGAVTLTLDVSAGGTGVPFTAEATSDSLALSTHDDAVQLTLDIEEAPPGPCPPERQVVLFSDTDEAGGDGWMITIGDYCLLPDCSDAAWAVTTDAAHEGAHSWHVAAFDGKASVSHRMVDAVSLVGVTEPVAVFHHRYDYEPGVDGGQVWVNPGSGFSHVPPVLAAGPGQAPTSQFFGDDAFTGQSPSWPGFDETRVDLSGHVGEDVRLVFNSRTSDAVGGPGWWVDGLEIRACEDPGGAEPSCPAGYALTELVTDTTESGGAGWGVYDGDYCFAADCADARWGLTDTAAHTGGHSWFGPNLAADASLSLVGTVDVDLTGDLSRPEALLFHRHDLEPYQDGGQIRLSADGGQSWGAVTYTMGAPTATVSIFGGNHAFTATNPRWPGFDEVRLDLSDHLGQRVRLRFEVRSGSSGANQGWWVDDLRVRACTKITPPTAADLALTLTGPASAAIDVEPLGYALGVENLGPLDATAVLVAVVVPDGLSLSGDGCEAAPGGLLCAVGDLARGEAAALTLTGVGTARGDWDVVATVAGDQPDPVAANDVAAVATSVLGAALFGAHLELVSAPDALTVGAAGTLTWAASNLGPTDAALTFHVAVPNGLTAPTPPGCLRDGAHVACDLGTVLAGHTPGELTLVVTASGPGPATVVAALAPTEGADPDALDPEPADDAVAHTIDVTAPAPVADLGVSVTAEPTAPLVGEPVTFTVAVDNAGPDVATELVLALAADGADFATTSDLPLASCDAAACQLAALGAGERWEVALVGAAVAPGALTVGAAIESATADPTAADDADETSVIAVAAVADLGVSWSDPPTAALAEQPLPLVVSVTNGGPLEAAAARCVFEVAGGRLVAVPDGCGLAASGAGAWCELGDLASGAVIELDLTAAAGAVGTPLTVTARVATPTADADPADDTAVLALEVVSASADLVLSAALETAAVVAVGDPVAARLDVTHAGGDPVTAARLSVTLPTGATGATAVTDRGGCVAGASAVACDLGDLAPGERAQVDLGFTATAPGLHEVSAAVGASAVDPEPVNDTARVAFSALLGCAGACDDGDPCTLDGCDPLVGCAHGAAPDGVACDDADPCSVGDACYAGVCIGGGPAGCDDGDPCTLDVCDPAAGCVHQVAPLACDDGDACTTGDVCAAGLCTPTGSLGCDDGDDCTLDGCDPGAGCFHTAAAGCCETDADCDDHAPCTADGCDVDTGDCAHVPVADGTSCDADGSACTADDACADGVCVAGPALDCDDGDVCTADACDPATGCTHGDVAGCCHAASDCPAGSTCEVATCDAATGACGLAAVPDGAPCDADQSACTAGDGCVDGGCVAGDALDCDDGDDCTVDACDALAGCQHTSSEAPGCGCAPETFATACTGGDVVWRDACDAPGEVAVGCDDGAPDTDDRCDEAAAVCLHVPAGAEDCDVACVGDWSRECVDGHVMWRDPCGVLAGVAAACASADPCLVASCDDGAAACVFAPSSDAGCGLDGGCDATRELACEAGDVVWRDGCGATVGPAAVCDDGDPRTDDGCDPTALACVSVPSAADLPHRVCDAGPADGVVEGGDLDPDVLDPDVLDPDVLDPDVPDPDVLDPDVLDPDVLDPDVPDVVTEEDVATADSVGPDADDAGDTEPPDTATAGDAVGDGAGGDVGPDTASVDAASGCGDCRGGAGGGPLFGLLGGAWLLLRRRRSRGTV